MDPLSLNAGARTWFDLSATVSAFHRCISHASCAAVELNAPEFTWATLKKAHGNYSVADSIEVADVSGWHMAFRAAQLASRGVRIGGAASTPYLLRAAWREVRA